MPAVGFTCKFEVDDGTASAYVALTGVTVITLPAEEVGEAEVTELNQLDDASASDPVRRWIPTKLIDAGTIVVESFYTKANHTRIRALHGVKGKHFKITAPGEATDGSSTTEVATLPGFVKKLGEIKYEKDVPVSFSFEVRVSAKGTFA
ncbi:MAG: hypothetical protein ABI780_02670 [Ardenticatenales bacterium]